MRITRTRPPTSSPSPAYFTGDVWVDEIATPEAPARVRVVSVHFAPGARTAWHTHPLGQVLHVTEGEGLVQRRGSPPEVVRAGDTVWFEPGEDHWHGAGPRSFMTHLAVHEALAGEGHVAWGAAVTDQEYAETPAGRESA
jgi:quercetin dioxygenase-like cupin family protein